MIMKLKTNHLTCALVALFALLTASCSTEGVSPVGIRTDALDDAAWDSSVWISAADADVVTGKISGKNFLAADGSSWFWSSVTNDNEVVSAKWMTAGLGVYDVYVNGHLVGLEILKPGFTHNAKTKYSFTYDITDAIDRKNGAVNELSAQVTPGWWGDKIVTPNGNEGMIGHKCAFRGVLEVVYADGTTKRYGTDLENWKAGIAGPVQHAAIFDGEFHDAREPMGYDVPEKLSVPEINNEFQGNIYPSAGAEIYLRPELAFSPVEAYVWEGVENADDDAYGKIIVKREYESGDKMQVLPGETLVVDFGQNAAAVPEFVFKAEEGTVLTCLPAELLNDGNGAKSRGMDGPEGSCHRLNLRTPEDGMVLEYTFADRSGYVRYSPRCTFYGYRYVSVTATAPVTIKSIVSVPVTSIKAEHEIGRITTGNELVNKLISNTVWGMNSNYLSVPTDCPQRNERLGWTADTQVFTETGTFFANTSAFFHKWMRDMRDSQSERGGFPSVAPYAQYGNETMRLGWADAGIIVPWTIWKQYGDLSIIEENWDAMERFITLINDNKYDHKALADENRGYQYADWLSYEALESHGRSAFFENNKSRPRPETIEYWNYLSASYWAIDAGMMSEMAAATGRDALVYKNMEAAAKEYLRTRFFNENGYFKTEVLNTMQTPALFALKNQLFDGQIREEMIARLRENFKSHDNCLQTGFLGTSILMSTLTENGMVDIAYELLFQRKNPSWLYSVDQGATTIWERWNSYRKDTGFGPVGMNSFNHYAYGAVIAWIYKTAAGIAADPSDPGFKTVIMAPVPDKRLGFVEAEYKSAAGLIKSAWRYEGEKWIWNFTVPEGSRAMVKAPGDNGFTEYKAGVYEIVR